MIVEINNIPNDDVSILKADLETLCDKYDAEYEVVENAPEQIPVVGNPLLEWTKDVPIKEGYYFCRYVDNQIKSLNKINIYRLHKCLYTDNENNRSLLVENTSLNNYKGAEWAGPIPEPQ